jgi:putative flippase GtrA
MGSFSFGNIFSMRHFGVMSKVSGMQYIVNFLLKFPLLRNISADSMYRYVWYTIIGAITFVVTNAFLYVYRRLLVWADVPSVAFSYALATICHFLLHNAITFKGSTESLRHRLGGHLTVSVINYFIGVGVTTAVIKVVFDNNIIASGCSTVVTLFLGYAMLTRFVYKLHKTGQEYKANGNY